MFFYYRPFTIYTCRVGSLGTGKRMWTEEGFSPTKGLCFSVWRTGLRVLQ
jgi:hypothetical protein